MNTTRRHTRFHPAWSRALVLLSGTVLTLGVTGCEEDAIFFRPCSAPDAPVAVTSVTGDEAVYLSWIPVDRDHVEEFVVYRAPRPAGPYDEIAHAYRAEYVDRDVRNGVTYYYAVSALGTCGYESELSRELVHDTPRPEGANATLFDANGDSWTRSGWEFVAYRSVPWDHPDADVYFLVESGVPFLVAADENTDIQDAGYGGFDDVSWAPSAGWSPAGAVELIAGHVYVVWTRDDHYAKVRVTQVTNRTVTFDWAYQVQRRNRELSETPQVRPVRTDDRPFPRGGSSGPGADITPTPFQEG